MMEGQETAFPGQARKSTVAADEGDVVDLTPDIQPNYDFFTDGPGYDALDM